MGCLSCGGVNILRISSGSGLLVPWARHDETYLFFLYTYRSNRCSLVFMYT